MIEINPQNGNAFWGRATAYFFNKKDYDRAISDSTKALEFFPQNALLFNLRGDSYYEKKQYSLALTDYSKAIEIDPTLAISYYNRGWAYDKLGQKDLAEADRRKYKELKKD